MKKLISLLLALIMLFSALSSSASAFAADKKYVADVLTSIQKQGGFVPGETAAVVGNCYGFISAVCEKLYGVKYQEQLNSDGYTCKHKTGYFYTVKTYKTTSSDTSSCVEDIIDFFVNNAYPGDIVHYASLSGSSHTFMIQSIDEDKMEIYHSNYQTKTLSSATCHIDTIIWDNFRKNPTKTEYNSDGSLLSHNSIFYNKQKRGGLGMTINRYTDYEKYFYPSYLPPTLSVSRSSSTSIKMKWTSVKGASKYRVEYKRSSAADYTVASSNCTDTGYNVTGLTVGKKYDFRVCAYAGGKWQDYSNVETQKVQPPTVSSASFTPVSDGLKLSWAKKTDLTGVRIYKSATKDGTFSLLKELGGTASSYTDKDVKYGETGYYRIQRYLTVDGTEYKSTYTTKTFAGTYALKTPVVSYTRPNSTSITFNFAGDNCQDSFDYYLVSDSNKTATATVNTDESSITLENLTLGESYSVFVREKTKIGVGSYGTLSVTAAPRAVSGITATQKVTGIRVDYSSQNDVSGYYVYRSTNGGSYSSIAKISDKTKVYYPDKTVKNNTSYKYVVKAFAVTSDGKEVIGDTGAATEDLKVMLSAPTGIKITRTSPSRVTLTWNKVSTANMYDIQYKVKGGKWITITGVKKTKRVIKKLTLGKKYYFRIRSTSPLGTGSYSKKYSIKVLPPAPKTLKAKSTGNAVKLTYKPKSYATGYYIYRAKSEKGKYKLIANVQSHKTKTYTDYNVTYGKTYYYKIACYIVKNGKTYKSAKSAAVECKLS